MLFVSFDDQYINSYDQFVSPDFLELRHFTISPQDSICFLFEFVS